MPHSFSKRFRLLCPECNQTIEAEIWAIVDIFERPDLKKKIQNGTLHDLQCPFCGAYGSYNAPLLIYAPELHSPLLFSPSPGTSTESNQRMASDLLDILQQRLGNAWSETWLEKGLPTVSRRFVPELIMDEAEWRERQKQMRLQEILLDLESPLRPLESQQAIALYGEAIPLVNREQDPYLWAKLQFELGNKLRSNPYSNQDNNLERAIQAYQLSLEVRAQYEDVNGQIDVLVNLGNAYADRGHGDRSENLETSLRLYNQALKLQSREADPYGWAMTNVNIAVVYLERIEGNKADNLEKAIDLCRQALDIIDQGNYPPEWALIMHSLALIYTLRIRGDLAENLETAIYYAQEALTVRTKETMPVKWAQTMVHLGACYAKRQYGDERDNLTRAISVFTESLDVWTRADFPYNWAKTLVNLGNSYKKRSKKKSVEDLERAIEYYTQALNILTSHDYPYDWAQTLINLGAAYRDDSNEDHSDNIEKAIECYQRAVEVLRPTNELGAMALDGLAGTYRVRLQGEHEENIRHAIEYCHQALKVLTREGNPAEYLRIQSHLGLIHFEQKNWLEAEHAFEAAIVAGKDLLASSYSEVGRRDSVVEASNLYDRAAYCLLQLGKPAEALTKLEEGKTRLLSQSLALAEAETKNVDPSKRDALQQIRQSIREHEAEMRHASSTNKPLREYAEALRSLRADLDRLIHLIRLDDPNFMPIGLTTSEILALIPIEGALVAPVMTSQGTAVFVIPYGTEGITEQHICWIDDFKEQTLYDLLNGTETTLGWIETYLNDIRKWEIVSESTMERLWQGLISPIHEKLQMFGVHRIVFMPTGGLQILPVHASWRMTNEKKRYLLDDYEIIYAPSAFAFKASLTRANRLSGKNAVIAGVGKYETLAPLRFTRMEADEVGRLFETKPMVDDEVTVEMLVQQLVGASYIHLACHGSFMWGQDPLGSSLYVANDEKLTLADILGRLTLNSARLVTLSACETGITDIREAPDEFIGLPAGFLQAGAAGVLSSLWYVDDFSTTLLMIKFYEYHFKDGTGTGESPVSALQRAQRWLRGLANEDLTEIFDDFRKSRTVSSSLSALAEKQFMIYAQRDPAERPFSHIRHWAAFSLYGN